MSEPVSHGSANTAAVPVTARPDDAIPVGGIPGDEMIEPRCPACGEPFDNWDCGMCGFSRSPKARKAHGKIMSTTTGDNAC